MTGALTEINSQCTHGSIPATCRDKTGRTVGVANYTGGSIAAYQIGRDGTSVLPQPCAASGQKLHLDKNFHGHSIDVDPENRFVAVSIPIGSGAGL